MKSVASILKPNSLAVETARRLFRSSLLSQFATFQSQHIFFDAINASDRFVIAGSSPDLERPNLRCNIVCLVRVATDGGDQIAVTIQLGVIDNDLRLHDGFAPSVPYGFEGGGLR